MGVVYPNSMEPIDSKYDECLGFVAEMCRSLEASVVSMLLYGSLARGQSRSPQSDVIDGLLVLETLVLNDEKAFYHTLDVMVETCERISAVGLPFHPFHYAFVDELPHAWPSQFSLTWEDETLSRVLWGADVRPNLKCAEEGLPTPKELAIAYRLVVQRFCRFLQSPDGSERESHRAFAAIQQFMRFAPVYACLACGYEIDESRAIGTIENHFSDVDVGLVASLEEVVNRGPVPTDSAEFRMNLTSVLALSEMMHDAILRRIRQIEQERPRPDSHASPGEFDKRGPATNAWG